MSDILAFLIWILVAAVVYFIAAALGLPYVICLVAALLVVVVGFTGRGRFGSRL